MATKYPLKNKKVLITCGPTWIAIDSMRIISNLSTGRMGIAIANELVKQKAKVTVLKGPSAAEKRSEGARLKKFCFYNDFQKLFKNELRKKYDIVIHAAAVSDFRLKKPFRKKISSDLSKLSLTLVPTEKLISKVKRINHGVFLVGFKFDSNITKKSAFVKSQGLFTKAKCDLVVANSIKNGQYKGFIVGKSKSIIAMCDSRKKVAKNLTKILKKAK